MPIHKVKNKGYKIENVKGISPTRDAAIERLQAIKAAQASRKAKPKPRVKVAPKKSKSNKGKR